jgi:hypothetical protein
MIDFQQLRAHLDNGETEYIMCAANWIDDRKHYKHKPFNIDTGLVFSGWRHGQINETSNNQFPHWLFVQFTTQGFLTTKNRFLNRKDALELVKKTGQLTKPLIGEELTSEDLW